MHLMRTSPQRLLRQTILGRLRRRMRSYPSSNLAEESSTSLPPLAPCQASSQTSKSNSKRTPPPPPRYSPSPPPLPNHSNHPPVPQLHVRRGRSCPRQRLHCRRCGRHLRGEGLAAQLLRHLKALFKRLVKRRRAKRYRRDLRVLPRLVPDGHGGIARTQERRGGG
jgi:hypothetical protein